MHRLLIILLYCAVTPAVAQIPTLSLGGGVATSNDATVGTASFKLLYHLPIGHHEDLPSGHHGVLFGLDARQFYGVPTQIERVTSTSSESLGTNGSSTITTLMGTVGYQLTIPSTPIHVAVTGSIGGANAAHRRLDSYVGFYNIDGEESLFYTTTIFASSIAYAVNTTIDVDLTSSFSLLLDLGYTWLSPSTIITDNRPYNAPSYRATFASPGPTLTLGLRYTLPNGLRDTLPNGLRDTLPNGLRSTLHVLAILASTHPFTTTPYNEFNPGLAIHWRSHRTGTTPFAEGGAYQYSLGDRAMYLGGGLLFPLGTEWIKGGIFGGAFATFDAQGVYFYPALSPRITIDTPWASATALLIPAGDATAIGFVIGLPIF
ncbi:MAG: hypothetical protein EHM43_12470 [Ignavibacteriae bacterium]|nr:MAG: hypothetical protein EHM43_12470 [Ignavibacteriota bacterium]